MSNHRRAALRESDELLEEIEQAVLHGLHRARMATGLRRRLVELARAVGHEKAVPTSHRAAHRWLLDLQGAHLLPVARANGHVSPVRQSERALAGSAKRGLYHGAQVPESLRCDPEWAYYAWQAAVDDAKRWPSKDRIQTMFDAWSHYWTVLQGAEVATQRQVA